MGIREGGLTRRTRQLAPLAALVGVAAAGAVATWQRRQRSRGPAGAPGPPAGAPATRPAGPVADVGGLGEPARGRSPGAAGPAAPSVPTGGRPALATREADPAETAPGAGGEAALAPRGAPPREAVPTATGPAAGQPAHEAPVATAPDAPTAGTSQPTPGPVAVVPPRAGPAPWEAPSREAPIPDVPTWHTPPVEPVSPETPAADAHHPAPTPPAPTPDAGWPGWTDRPDDPEATTGTIADAGTAFADAELRTGAARSPASAPASTANGSARPAGPSPDAVPGGPVVATTARAEDRRGRRRFVTRQAAALRRHRARLAAGLAVAALGVGVSVVVSGTDEAEPDRPSRPAAGETVDTGPADATATTPPAVSADGAFGRAAATLTEAGTFTYAGTVRATDVSVVRPMVWLAVETSVAGEVDLATERLHEVAVAADGLAAETIAEGTTVWGRRAARPALDGAGYAIVPELSGSGVTPARGLVMLPAWLRAAGDPAEIAPSPAGQRRFRATVPGEVVGAVERGAPPEDIVVVLTLDGAGTPVGLEIASATSDRLALSLELTALGDPVAITPPAPAPTPAPA